MNNIYYPFGNIEKTAVAVAFVGEIRSGESTESDFKKILPYLEMTFDEYIEEVPFYNSYDRLAYTTPWYTYDFQHLGNIWKNFNYNEFVYQLYKKYGIETASLFFTKEFRAAIPLTAENLKKIERIFFCSRYSYA